MTPERLISEGRKLERTTVFLRPQVSGPVAAVWYERDDNEIESTGHRCWLTVDAKHIPGLASSIGGFVSIFTNEKKCEGGRVELTSSWPKRSGTQLYAHAARVLPPIDAVFLRGSESVGEWLSSAGWQREWRYNDNFRDQTVSKPYRKIFGDENPIYNDSDVYAMLGGWHFSGQDPDWQELIDEHLMLMTFRDSEPWVEAWHTKGGAFKVFQRIT